MAEANVPIFRIGAFLPGRAVDLQSMESMESVVHLQQTHSRCTPRKIHALQVWVVSTNRFFLSIKALIDMK